MISIKNINKWYGDFQVLTDCSTEVKKGEVIVVCGPSGSGKSTLIKCVNALEPFQKGDIVVDGTSIADPKTNLPKLRSRVGMVFQHFELFPHLTITENLTIAQIKVLGRSKEEATKKVCNCWNALACRRMPTSTRATVRRSAAACGDCPCAGDGPDRHAVRRTDLGARSGNGQRSARRDGATGQEGMTMMCVTHEMGFARKVADRVIFMDAGKIIEDCPKRSFRRHQRPLRTRAAFPRENPAALKATH